VLAAADRLLLQGRELLEASGVWRPHVIRVYDRLSDQHAIWGPYESAVAAGDAIPRVLDRMAAIAKVAPGDVETRFKPSVHWLRPETEPMGN